MIFRCILFWVFFIVMTGVIGIIGIVTLSFMFQASNFYIVDKWCRLMTWSCSYFCNIKVVVKGLENLPKGGYIAVSKHQSMWETLFFPTVMKNAAAVVKRELVFIPVYGLYLYFYGMVMIDRSKGAKILNHMIQIVKERMQQGRVVFIFPEGTRVKPGVIAPIKPGIAAIHNEMPDVPIVPVYLDSGYVWPRKSLYIRSGTITVSFKKPIIGACSKEELLQKLQNEINSED